MFINYKKLFVNLVLQKFIIYKHKFNLRVRYFSIDFLYRSIRFLKAH